MNQPRSEYPRPQLVRENWQSLNGVWDFSFTETARETGVFEREILVPYAYQSKCSGIDDQDFHDVVFYRKRFTLPRTMAGKLILLHFGAVDYYSQLWVNGQYVREHTGGHIGFSADITGYLTEGENTLVVRAEDPARDLEMPRGKQYWERTSDSIFYTRTTGIWQTVWLEAVERVHLKSLFLTPQLDEMSVEIQYETSVREPVTLTAALGFEGREITVHRVTEAGGGGRFSIGINQQDLGKWQLHEQIVWTPEHPRLIDVELSLAQEGRVTDRVKSYFGMRKVSIENGKFCLNNRPYYQKLLLDQGYWARGLLTAPADEDYVTDIRLAKEMGFNGVRKHQKIEDPRFFYHADRMGFLVWGEMAAAYSYSRRYVARITAEWTAEILRDYNHPCIVAWTPLNESWGVTGILKDKAQQHHSAAMVHLTKSLDSTRPVISNDGWEHTCTDLLTIHDYEPHRETLTARYESLQSILSAQPCQRFLFAEGWSYDGQPILVTEFGGISYQKGKQTGWGYSAADSDEDFAARYEAVVAPLLASPCVQGFCYTQLTDVEQEINGLLTDDRKPKIDPAVIRAINQGGRR